MYIGQVRASFNRFERLCARLCTIEELDGEIGVFKTYYFIEWAHPGGAQPALAAQSADPFVLSGAQIVKLLAPLDLNSVGCVLSRTIEAREPDSIPDYAGVLELWFERADLASASVRLSGPIAACLAPGFRIGPVVTGLVKTVMRTSAFYQQPCVKGVFPFRRKPGMSLDAFQHHWWHTHGPIAAGTPEALNYYQCHPFLSDYEAGAPPYDGVTELYWADMDRARAAMSSSHMTVNQANDAKNFADGESIALFFATEEIIVAP